jgi:hypothetical protein
MRLHRLAVSLALAATAAVGTAQPVTAEMSPRVTWDPYRNIGGIPADERVAAADETWARDRAARFFDALKVSPTFQSPNRCATLLNSRVRLRGGLVNQGFYPYCSAPRDVRRTPDGTLTPVLGGAHDLFYIDTHWLPGGYVFEERDHVELSRQVDNGVAGGYFAAPRAHGELAGGVVYSDVIVFTRDGRSALEPAPIGTLLDIERARLATLVGHHETGFASRLAELNAMMAPEAVAERRAKRDAAWQRETPDPVQRARRLDAAHRSDESYHERETRHFTPPATRDATSVYWRPRLALEAAEQALARLDAAGRAAPACARREPGFSGTLGVRYERVDAGLPDCLPMMQVRRDLLDTRRPRQEVQLLTVWFRSNRCGEHWSGTPLPVAGRCSFAVPLLREMDWAAARQALGWAAR